MERAKRQIRSVFMTGSFLSCLDRRSHSSGPAFSQTVPEVRLQAAFKGLLRSDAEKDDSETLIAAGRRPWRSVSSWRSRCRCSASARLRGRARALSWPAVWCREAVGAELLGRRVHGPPARLGAAPRASGSRDSHHASSSGTSRSTTHDAAAKVGERASTTRPCGSWTPPGWPVFLIRATTRSPRR